MGAEKLAAWDKESGELNVVVETAAGSRNKYKYDKKLGAYLLHKVLPAGAVFPFDFGFVAGTRGEDGDPLDMLLLLDVPVFTGCLVCVRLIGVLEAKQTEEGKTERNDRLIGVAGVSKDFAKMRRIKDVDRHLREEIEHFFISYNEEQGRKFRPLGFKGVKRAEKLVEEGIKRAKKGGGR